MENSDLPVLIGQAGPLNGEIWGIREALVIGRDASCDVVVPERQVSRFHARLNRNENGVMLEDLASKNGTYVNGTRIIDPEYLQDGDVIQIALVQSMVFLSSDATMPMEYDSPIPDLDFAQEQRLRLESQSHRVWIENEEVLPPLSLPQFKLLETLYQQQNQIVSRGKLVDSIWSSEDAVGVTEQALDALVRRLRERLADVDPAHDYIITVRGHGLRLDNSSE